MKRKIKSHQFIALALVLASVLAFTACPLGMSDARKLINANNVIAHSVDTLSSLNKNLLDTDIEIPQDAIVVAHAVKDADKGLRESQKVAAVVKANAGNLTQDDQAKAIAALTQATLGFQSLVAVGATHIKNPDKQKAVILAAQAGLTAANTALAIVAALKTTAPTQSKQ